MYATFLGNIYRDNFTGALPEGFSLSGGIVDGLVGAQLISSILSVSCVTVAFCSNFLMVQDKANGTIKDFRISPVRPGILAMGYYAATLLSTLLICFAAAGSALAMWLLRDGICPLKDVCLLFLDVALLVFFGVALSSLINFFLSTQGQISAVGDHYQRRVRIYLRGVYAHFLLRRGPSKSTFLSSGDLRNFPDPQSYHERRAG